ncbi:imidazole glycerol phosphate synthase subunit HisH [bacterium]|nr:imidazole glycerol phosphate synthase subunit HisH [bacterium]QQR57815.1 MAG: imidazole glycerol phosphate synthase subunit HisH [Candidatus Melainabacteria bacterium]
MKTEIEVDLVNIDGGNKGSVLRLLERLNVSVNEVGFDNLPKGNRPLILPGVGAFGAVMQSIEKGGLSQCVSQLVKSGTPYLGICVGMQILFDGSEETPGVNGLGLVPGSVVRFLKGKVPQIGWNKLDNLQNNGYEPGYAYFVNSYYAVPTNSSDTLYSADYYERFCAAVQRDNITGFQFHPEKSGAFGQKLMQRWLFDVSK